ncbi:MAG TPA: molybdopterin-dependent oxidoreductase [Thermoanaerobaculaceae bacterium]|nr:molybdopterin-dependent oxidoreductase [Thermoanaerobaculaceae bacterium]
MSIAVVTRVLPGMAQAIMRRGDAPLASTVLTTACPRDCYSTCSLRVEIEDGQIRRIEPHPGNLATGKGVCIKGLAYVERSVSPNRLTVPLRRKDDGSFAPIGWDEALDQIASELTRISREWGPQAVLFFAGTGTKGLLNGVSMAFWRLFGGCTTTYGDLCWPAGLEATRLTLGDNLHNAPWDLANARLIVFWGKNAAETNVHQMDHLALALAAGAQVVVIDPRRTETAERAELLVQPRPGTDGALALGIAHVLIERSWIDRAFIAAHVRGLEPFAALARTWPPARAAEVSGVPVAVVERLAVMLGTIHPATIVPGFGMQRYTNSGQAMRAMLALLALTGQIGRPGAGWMYANLATQVFGPLRDPLDCYPPVAPDGVVRVAIPTARLGQGMQALTDPPLMAAWIERANPIPQHPETPAVVEAFRRLEFRVVVDELLTDTARTADIVLPAKNLFEQTDVIGAYWHPYLQLRQKLVEPPPHVRPETEVYWALAERLGFDPGAMEAHLVQPGGEEAWLRRRLEPWPEITLENLREGPVLAPGAAEVAFSDLRFPTPSGRIELWSDEARVRWGLDELPGYSEPVESQRSALAARFPLVLLTPNTKTRIHSQFGCLDTLRRMEPGPVLSMSPDDALVRGIAEGDEGRVFNDRGELRLPVRLDGGIRPGVVSVPNGFWLAEGAVNLLSLGRETDMGHGAAFHENLVEVEKAR